MAALKRLLIAPTVQFNLLVNLAVWQHQQQQQQQAAAARESTHTPTHTRNHKPPLPSSLPAPAPRFGPTSTRRIKARRYRKAEQTRYQATLLLSSASSRPVTAHLCCRLLRLSSLLRQHMFSLFSLHGSTLQFIGLTNTNAVYLLSCRRLLRTRRPGSMILLDRDPA